MSVYVYVCVYVNVCVYIYVCVRLYTRRLGMSFEAKVCVYVYVCVCLYTIRLKRSFERSPNSPFNISTPPKNGETALETPRTPLLLDFQ